MFERVGLYFYIFPTYTQGRKVLWDGIDKEGFKFMNHLPEALRKKTSDQQMKVKMINDSVFQVVGSNDTDSIVGTNPVGCVFSEYSLQDPIAWDLLRPILAENDGWAIFNFTPRGENHAYDLLEMAKNDPSWFTEVLTVNDTGAISPEVLMQERKEIMAKNGDDSIYQQEYFCSFTASLRGSYYGKLVEDAQSRMGKSMYEQNFPVYTAWDLGMDDSTTIIFFQALGSELRIIDYMEGSGEGLAYYAKEIDRKPYRYGGHYLPHDVEVRELGTGQSRHNTLIQLGFKNIVVVKRPEAKEDGIEAVRAIFNHLWFDVDKTERLLKALKHYSHKYDEKNKTYLNTPSHDWSSHGADALQTLALGHKAEIKSLIIPAKKPNLDPYE